jgi:hypothetical protein
MSNVGQMNKMRAAQHFDEHVMPNLVKFVVWVLVWPLILRWVAIDSWFLAYSVTLVTFFVYCFIKGFWTIEPRDSDGMQYHVGGA